STTTIANGGDCMVAALARSSLRKVERLNVTIAMAIFPGAEFTPQPYRAAAGNRDVRSGRCVGVRTRRSNGRRRTVRQVVEGRGASASVTGTSLVGTPSRYDAR